MSKLIAKLTNKISQALFIQAVLTVVSTPLLIAWGLPIAILGPLGNLIFTPFLLVFLTLTIIITLCELLNLPDQLVITALEQFTNFWLKLTQWGPKNSLLGLPKSALLFFSILALGTVLLMLVTTRPQFKKVLVTSIIIMCLGASYFAYFPNTQTQELVVTHQKYQLNINYKNQQIYLTDQTRLLAHVYHPISWCEHTLRPILIKNFGNIPIAELNLVKPTARIKNIAPEIQAALGIKKIVIT
jgi:hypothetical protein